MRNLAKVNEELKNILINIINNKININDENFEDNYPQLFDGSWGGYDLPECIEANIDIVKDVIINYLNEKGYYAIPQKFFGKFEDDMNVVFNCVKNSKTEREFCNNFAEAMHDYWVDFSDNKQKINDLFRRSEFNTFDDIFEFEERKESIENEEPVNFLNVKIDVKKVIEEYPEIDSEIIYELISDIETHLTQYKYNFDYHKDYADWLVDIAGEIEKSTYYNDLVENVDFYQEYHYITELIDNISKKYIFKK